MTWQEALEVVVARTGHDRYRSLCSEDNPCPHGRDAYRALVRAMAAGDHPPAATQPPRATTPPDPWAARIRACPDHNPGCCSSPAPYCTRYAINPTRDQCVSCLESSDHGDVPAHL